MSNISVTTVQNTIDVTNNSGITVTTPEGQTIVVSVPNSSVNVTNTTDEITVVTNGQLTYNITADNTDQIPEGVVNLYYTDARADARVALGTADKVNRTGDTMTGNLILNADPTTNLGAATKQYVDSAVSGSAITNTDELPEGTTNLYFETQRARESISGGTGISYDSATGVITSTATGNITSVNGQTGPTVVLDTDDVSEGTTNKYFSQTLARQSLSAGTGISYDNTTGVITNTVPDTNTTYTQNFSSTTGGANLNLVGSDSTTDSVKFANGIGVTVTRTDADTATIDIGQDVATSAHPTFAGLTSTRTTTGGGRVVDSNGDVLVQKAVVNSTQQQPVAAFFDNTTANRRGVIVAREYGQNVGINATSTTVGQSAIFLEASRGTASSPVAIGSNNNTIGVVGVGTYDGSRWSTESALGSPGLIFFQNTEPPSFETSSFTADIASNGVMTVTSVSSGSIHPGQLLTGTGIPVGALVASYGNDTFGGTGTYNLNFGPSPALTGVSITGVGTTRSGMRIGLVQQPSGNKFTGATRQTYLIAAQTGTSTETINGVTIGNNAGTNLLYGNIDGSANIQLPSSDGTRVYQGRGKQNISIAGGQINHTGVTDNDLATFQGYISGNILTVTSMSSGSISQGALVNATGIAQGTFISSSYGTGGTTGTGQTGTYTITSTFATAGQTIGSSGSPVNMVTTADNNAARGSNYWSSTTTRKSPIPGRYAPLKNGDNLLQITTNGSNGSSVSANNINVGGLGWTSTQDFTPSQAGTRFEVRTADINTTNNNTRLRLASDRNDYYSNEHYFFNATGTGNSVYIGNSGNLKVGGGTLDIAGSVSGRFSLQAQATGTDQTYILPNADGTSNQVLTTDGAGNLSWTTVSGGGGVSSITGTANQVIASSSTGAVTLSLPQDINSTAQPTFAGLDIVGAYNDIQPISYTANLDSASPYAGASIGIRANYRATDGGALVVPQNGWSLGNLRFNSYEDTSGSYVLANSIISQATENWSTGNNGSRLTFQTVPNGQSWTNPIASLVLASDYSSYTSNNHIFNAANGVNIANISDGTLDGKPSLSINQTRATQGSDFALINFNTQRSTDGINFTATQQNDNIGEFKFNGNAYTGTNPGVPLGPCANIGAYATETWDATKNGAGFYFNCVKTGSLDTLQVINATSIGLNLSSQNINLYDDNSTALVGSKINYNRVYGQFEYNTTVTPAATNTAYVFPLGTAAVNNIATVGSTSRLIAGAAGTYNLQFSVQVNNADNGQDHIAYVWLRKNGVDVTGSTGHITVPKSTGTISSWNYLITSDNITDYWEIGYAVSDLAITFPFYAATAFCPSTASVITTLTPIGA